MGKWGLFGVILPLLPIVGRIAAFVLDDNASSLTFVDLFGDGELLVLATVIAAAGIGDLTLDFAGDRQLATRRGRRVAVANAFSLLIVVVSVLLFGLVTFASQTRADARSSAVQERSSKRLDAQRAANRTTQLTLQAERDSARAKALQARRGQHGRARRGTLAYAFLQETARLTRQLAVAQDEAAQLSTEAEKESIRRLAGADASLTRGRERAAWLSVMMFLLSLVVGGRAAWLTAAARLDARAKDALPEGLAADAADAAAAEPSLTVT
jgi:hypothetical protein